MRIWRSLGEVEFGQAVVAIGNFDGVHRGHQGVIRRAKRLADERCKPLVAVVLGLPNASSVLTPSPVRVELLGALGVDAVLELPPDILDSAWSAGRFVDDVLVGGLSASALVVSPRSRIGRGADGDASTMRELCAARGLDVETVDLGTSAPTWSSTCVRAFLAAGDVVGATQAMGRPFAVRGEVVSGDRRGRLLGFPTANVALPVDSAIPADGVYAGRLVRCDTEEAWPAAISVGTNPTFRGERARRVEGHVLDRDDLDLYGVVVEVAFTHRLRGVVAFDSVDALIAQMHQDIGHVRDLMGSAAARSARIGPPSRTRIGV